MFACGRAGVGAKEGEVCKGTRVVLGLPSSILVWASASWLRSATRACFVLQASAGR